MNRKKYYISIASSEISQVLIGNNDDFTIYATDDEVRLLRAKMDNMHSADIRSFFRSYVPIMPYHMDKSNKDYDAGITDAFQMIYQLGDEQTKSHIEGMGVLGDRHM